MNQDIDSWIDSVIDPVKEIALLEQPKRTVHK